MHQHFNIQFHLQPLYSLCTLSDAVHAGCSVLVHLLPGLALFALQHAPVPSAVSQHPTLHFLSLAETFRQPQAQWQPQQLLWLMLAPVVFYAAWQFVYWFIVQVCCEKFILQHKYETSYSCLAKRSAKINSPLGRYIRQGCKARRIFLFGMTSWTGHVLVHRGMVFLLLLHWGQSMSVASHDVLQIIAPMLALHLLIFAILHIPYCRLPFCVLLTV